MTRPAEMPEFTADEIADAMKLAGIDPARVHAFRKTGFIPTEETWELFTAAERAEWNAAIAEYDRTHAKKKGKTKGAGA